ncbi:MAG TPA: hypothetical protein VMF89_21205, partial [Polyangiales bacterium]|nr:hypothetical protein [Polyangiales bacterium]
DAAQSQKASSTWVAIHVQLRHEPAPAESIFDAPPDHDDDEDDDEVFVDAAPELSPQPKALPAPASASALSEAFFASKVFASATGKQTRATGILHYLATRALNAYLAQSSFASVATSEPRMLDVQA